MRRERKSDSVRAGTQTEKEKEGVVVRWILRERA